VWLAFTAQSGREQAGRRPALVLTPAGYNDRTSLAICCPVTSRVKGYPFEVGLPAGGPVEGAVLADQVKSLDWRTRAATFAGRATPDVIEEVMAKLGALLTLQVDD
jgi:mRNA interferase MazF